jgi:hypothetical protein
MENVLKLSGSEVCVTNEDENYFYVKINDSIAEDLKIENFPEYLVWEDGTEISKTELSQFNLLVGKVGTTPKFCLSHKKEDYWIYNLNSKIQ